MLSLKLSSILLIVATPLAFLPQYTRIITLHSSNRVSLPASVLLALSAQIQLVSMYYTFVCHPETRYGGIVTTPPETQDWLDLVQLAVQWACSLLQLTLVIAFDPRPESSPPFEPTTPPTSAHGRSMSGRNAIALNLILVHAAL
ncbi:hypothetical protein Q7P36_006436 [Cladosporium allicinum]